MTRNWDNNCFWISDLSTPPPPLSLSLSLFSIHAGSFIEFCVLAFIECCSGVQVLLLRHLEFQFNFYLRRSMKKMFPDSCRCWKQDVLTTELIFEASLVQPLSSFLTSFSLSFFQVCASPQAAQLSLFYCKIRSAAPPWGTRITAALLRRWRRKKSLAPGRIWTLDLSVLWCALSCCATISAPYSIRLHQTSTHC